MMTTPDDKREALAAIVAAHPGNGCAVQCVQIRADFEGLGKVDQFEKFALLNEDQRYLPARFVNLDSLMKGELAENEFRKEFTPSERVAIGEAIERELEGKNHRPAKETPENFPGLPKGDTRDIAAKAAGNGNGNDNDNDNDNDNGKTVELGDVEPKNFVMAQNKARRRISQAPLAMATTAAHACKCVGHPAFAQSGTQCPIATTNSQLAEATEKKAARCSSTLAAIKKINIHKNMNATNMIANRARPEGAKAGFGANLRAAISPAPLSAAQPYANAEVTQVTRVTAPIHAGLRCNLMNFSEVTGVTKRGFTRCKRRTTKAQFGNNVAKFLGRPGYPAVKCCKVLPGAEKHHGFGSPLTSCDESRSHTQSAAFLFAPPVFGGSDGRVHALPVSARMSRSSNLSELPPSFGSECVGFCKSTSLEAIMANSACALAHSLPALGNPDQIQLHAEAHNALAMAVHYLTQPQANVPGAARKAVQALAALRRLDVTTTSARV